MTGDSIELDDHLRKGGGEDAEDLAKEEDIDASLDHLVDLDGGSSPDTELPLTEEEIWKSLENLVDLDEDDEAKE